MTNGKKISDCWAPRVLSLSLGRYPWGRCSRDGVQRHRGRHRPAYSCAPRFRLWLKRGYLSHPASLGRDPRRFL